MSTALQELTPPMEFNSTQIELLKRTICVGGTDDELKLFTWQCQRTGLDPFARQIYAIKRWDSNQKKLVMAVQTSIDGFRLIAERTGKYRGQEPTLWCGTDGVWRDVWISKEKPVAAKVGVLKQGFDKPCYAVALFSEYAQYKKDGGLTNMWDTKPAIMISKCAEALSIRKAFPQELSGLYTSDEMPHEEAPPQNDRPNLQNPQIQNWQEYKPEDDRPVSQPPPANVNGSMSQEQVNALANAVKNTNDEVERIEESSVDKTAELTAFSLAMKKWPEQCIKKCWPIVQSSGAKMGMVIGSNGWTYPPQTTAPLATETEPEQQETMPPSEEAPQVDIAAQAKDQLAAALKAVDMSMDPAGEMNKAMAIVRDPAHSSFNMELWAIVQAFGAARQDSGLWWNVGDKSWCFSQKTAGALS